MQCRMTKQQRETLRDLVKAQVTYELKTDLWSLETLRRAEEDFDKVFMNACAIEDDYIIKDNDDNS